MTCLIPKNWPVHIKDDDPEDGNEAEYSRDGLEHYTVQENENPRLNVFVCFVINLAIQVLMSFVDIAVKDSNLLDELDINTTDANSANNFYKSLTDVYAPLALYLMSITSYKVTVAVGSILICTAFINISFLYNGPAIGVSCLKLGALMPVLEYYKRDRLKVLIITRVGTVLGAAATIGIMFAESLSWKTLFRLNAGICIPCFAIAFMLKDIVITKEMTEENERRKQDDTNKNEDSNAFCMFLKSTFNIPILKEKTFWITVVVFFFFSFGTSLPKFSLPGISTEMQEQLAPPVESFYEVLSSNVGKLVGLILTYALKSLTCVKRYRERKHKMGFVFSTITLSGYIMAILSIITSDDYIYYIVYIFVLTIFEVLTENFRDDSMPTAFGRFTIRLTQGFLHISMGLAGVTASAFQNGIERVEVDKGWKFNFRLGGGLFLMSGSITGIVLIINKCIKSKRQSPSGKGKRKTSFCPGCFSIFCCKSECYEHQHIYKERKYCPSVCCTCFTKETPESTNCCTCLSTFCKETPECTNYCTSISPFCKETLGCTNCCACISPFCKKTPESTNCCTCISPFCKETPESTNCCTCISPFCKETPEYANCCTCISPFCKETPESTNCCTCISPFCCQKKPSDLDKSDPTQTNTCCAFPFTCFRKKRNLSKTKIDTTENESALNINCCKSFSSFCFQKNKSISQSHPENDEKTAKMNINCCKGFPLPCFQNKRAKSQIQAKKEKGDTAIDINCYKGCSLSFFQKKQSIIQTQPESYNDEAYENIKYCKGFPTICFQRKYPISEVHEEINKSESSIDIDCFKGYTPSCFQKKGRKPKKDTNIYNGERINPNMQNEQDESSCKCSVLSKCLHLPQMSCLSPKKSNSKRSSNEDETSVGESNVMKRAESSALEISSDKKNSACKGFTFSNCLTFSSMKSLSSNNSSQEKVLTENTAKKPSSQKHRKEQEQDKKVEDGVPLCKGLTFSNCLKFPNKQCLSPNESNSDTIPSGGRTALTSATSENNSKRPESEISLEHNSSSSKGVTHLSCLPYPNIQCLWLNKSRSDLAQPVNITRAGSVNQNSSKILKAGMRPKQNEHDNSSLKSSSEELGQNAINSNMSVKQQVIDIFSCNCFYPKFRPTLTNRISPTSNQIKIVGPSFNQDNETSTDLNVIIGNGSQMPFLRTPSIEIDKRPQHEKEQNTTSKQTESNDESFSIEKNAFIHCCPQLRKKHFRRLSEEISSSNSESNQEDLDKPKDGMEVVPKKDVSIDKSDIDLDLNRQLNPKDFDAEQLKLDQKKVNTPSRDLPSPSRLNTENGDKDETTYPLIIPNIPSTVDSVNNMKNIATDETLIPKGNGKKKESSDSEESPVDCPKLERALAPPTEPIYLNRRLRYEANRTDNAQREKKSEPINKRKRKYLSEVSDSEDEAIECPKYERAIAPPTEPSYREKRLRYEANRIKNAHRERKLKT